MSWVTKNLPGCDLAFADYNALQWRLRLDDALRETARRQDGKTARRQDGKDERSREERAGT
jgi:hypothetical protein